MGIATGQDWFAGPGDMRPPHQMESPSKCLLPPLGERPMDGFGFTLFVFAAFAGGFVIGLSGCAMGLVVSGVWLHIITPIQTATLIAGYGLVTQSYGIWKLRHALNWRSVA